MTTPSSVLRRTVALALVVPLLAGCASAPANSREDARYPNRDEALASKNASRIPDALPEDARVINLGYNTVDPGTVLSFSSATGVTSEGCTAGRVTTEPSFTPTWWPRGESADEGVTCGDWTIVAHGDRYLAWD